MSSQRPESGMRPFRGRGRFPRRFNRGGFNRGGYHKDYHKPDYHKDYRKDYHRDFKHYHHHDKYDRHYYSQRRHSRSRSRSRSYSRTPDKYYEKKRHRSRSYSHSRSRSRSRSHSRSRSRSLSRYSRSRSRSRSSSRSRSRTLSKYNRSYTPDVKKTRSPGAEATEKNAAERRPGTSLEEVLATTSVKNILAGSLKAAKSLKPEPRSAKDMPLYSDEELEQVSEIPKRGISKFKINLTQDVRTSLLERAMIEKQKLGLVNPGSAEKSSALEALQCYSPDAHHPSPYSDQGHEKVETYAKELQSRIIERDAKPAPKSALKLKPLQELTNPLAPDPDTFSNSPAKSQQTGKPDHPNVLTNIPGLGFSSVDEEDEFLYGQGGGEEKGSKSGSKPPYSKKLWLESEKEHSSTWSDEDDHYEKKGGRDSLLNRISRSPSPVTKAPVRTKPKMFDLGELFTPSLKSETIMDADTKSDMDVTDEMPLMINQPVPEDKKVKMEVAKSLSIWESPEEKHSVKREKPSPVIKRIVSDAPLSPFRNRQGSWRPESRSLSSADKNAMALDEDSIPLSIEIKRTVLLGSPVSDRSKRSDSYHSVDQSREKQRRKQAHVESTKSQYKFTELCDNLKGKKEKVPSESVREEHLKKYEIWEDSPRPKGSVERDNTDKDRHPRDHLTSSKYKKSARQYSTERSPGYDHRHRSPYHSPSYSPYQYSPRRRSPYGASPSRSNYYSPYRSPERGGYDRSPGRSYDRSSGRSYERSPSPGYYKRRERYRSPGRRSSSYSPPRNRGAYNRKYSRSPSPPRQEMHNIPPDIPLPPQPPPPPAQHFQPFYDPNIAPPPQYPPQPAPPPFPPGPVSYPIVHGPPPPFPGQYPHAIPQPSYTYPPLPVSAPIAYPPPPPPVVSAERTNLKVIPLQDDKAGDTTVKEAVLKPLTGPEREKIAKDKEEKMSQHQTLKNELEQLQKLQGEMMRKKQRQKDGHKDPLILENTKLQEEIKNQISQMEVSVRVMCQTLGESPPDFDAVKTEQTITKKEEKEDGKQNSNESTDKELSVQFEYFDPGNHWCKQCNQFLTNSAQFLMHLQTPEHLKKLDPKYRPWSSNLPKKRAPIPGKQPVFTPLKGAHFLIPVSGFYCSLCNNLLGDAACAEEHLRTIEHNRNFTKHTLLNPHDEKHWNREKLASMAEFKKQEKLRLKALEVARLQEDAKKKKKDMEAERRHKELIRSEREKAKPSELDDYDATHSHRHGKNTSKEKQNIKLTLLTEKDSKECKKKTPVVLIGKAPNFKSKDDGSKGVGISKLQGWKKGGIKREAINQSSLQKARHPGSKDDFDASPSNEISPGDALSGVMQTLDTSLIHGPHLPPDLLDTSSQSSKALPPMSWEEQNDLNMLGIDREDFVMIAAPRPPPVTSFSGSISVTKVSNTKSKIRSNKESDQRQVKTTTIDLQDIPVPTEPAESSDVVDMDIDEPSDSDTVENSTVGAFGLTSGPPEVGMISKDKHNLSQKEAVKLETRVLNIPSETEKIIDHSDSSANTQNDQQDMVLQNLEIIEQIGESLIAEVAELVPNSGSGSNTEVEEQVEPESTPVANNSTILAEDDESTDEDDMMLMLEEDEPDENNSNPPSEATCPSLADQVPSTE